MASLDAIRDLVTESTVTKQFDHPPLLGVCVDPDNDDAFKVILLYPSWLMVTWGPSWSVTEWSQPTLMSLMM